MGRRAHGDGTIRKRKDGRWVGYAPRQPDGRRPCVYATTRGEAATKLRSLIRDLESGRTPPDRRMTVEKWLEHWLTTIPADRSPNTVDNYVWAIKHINNSIASIAIADLTAFDVERLLNTARRADLTRNSVMRIKVTLGMALREAEKHDLVHRNVAKLASMPGGTWKETKPRKSLTLEQAKAFRNHVDTERLGAAFLTALCVGLRPGEVCGLPWDAVDLDEGVLTITQTLKRHEGKVLALGEVKTAKSRRALRIPPFLVERLRHHRLRQAEERLAMGPAWIDTGLVFTTEVGTYVDPSNFRRYFKRLMTTAGIEGDWTPYELRHSGLSILSAVGIPIENVSDVAGHTDTRTTMTVYRHHVAPVIEHAAQPMQDLLGEVEQS